MYRKKNASISHYHFSDSSSDSDIDQIKEIKDNLSQIKKTLKNTVRPQSPAPKKSKQTPQAKERPKSGATDKGNTSMFDLGKGNSEKVGVLRNKRSSVRPMKVHDISVSNSNILQRQLQDEHVLKVKVNSLEKSIKSQEKALRNIRKKLITEKSDLWGLKEKICLKEKMEHEELRRENSVVVLDGKKEKKKLVLVRKESKENKENSRQMLEYERGYVSEKTAEFGSRDRRQELEKEKEENIEKICEMKEYIRGLTRKYELEIEGLRTNIGCVSEENVRIRSNAISMKDHETIELMYDRKIREMEEKIAVKDREIAEKEGYYKGQIEDIQVKMEELQREVKRMGSCEGLVEELTQQLQLKEKEMCMSKKYYVDKLQTKIDEQTNQKREWLIVYNGLLSDIRNLKGDIDGYGPYGNRKLNGSDSSERSKEEVSFMSSRRTGQGS